MTIKSFVIRVCNQCGLRYPVTNDQSASVRCPACLGDTLIRGRYPIPGDPPAFVNEKSHHTLAVLLDNIRSGWNVGSILRTSEGLGFDRAFLCGITPQPVSDAVKKTSLGAEVVLPWSYHEDSVKLAHDLRVEGWILWGLEESASSLPLDTMPDHLSNLHQQSGKIILAIGNETAGIDPEFLIACDKVFNIPTRGGKRSFNVAVAFGMAAYIMAIREY